MTIEVYGAFILASILLAVIPGPNVALIIATSLRRGTSKGAAIVAGTTMGQCIQIGIAVAGLTALAVFLAEIFTWVRWLGVVYLGYLAVKSWRAKPDHVEEKALRERYFSQGFFVALINPKTLLFHGAFLPQFINPMGDVLQQSLLLAVSFIVVVTVIDLGFAVLAGAMRDKVQHLSTRTIGNKLIACVYAGAATGLAFARR